MDVKFITKGAVILMLGTGLDESRLSLNYNPKISKPIRYLGILPKYLILHRNTAKKFATPPKILPPLYLVLKMTAPQRRKINLKICLVNYIFLFGS